MPWKWQSNGWEAWPAGPGTYGEAAIVMEVGTGDDPLCKKKLTPTTIRPAALQKLVTTLGGAEKMAICRIL